MRVQVNFTKAHALFNFQICYTNLVLKVCFLNLMWDKGSRQHTKSKRHNFVPLKFTQNPAEITFSSPKLAKTKESNKGRTEKTPILFTYVENTYDVIN